MSAKIQEANAELQEALDALAWLTEMAGYAQEHLDRDWRRKNGGDYSSALGQAGGVLSKHGRYGMSWRTVSLEKLEAVVKVLSE